MYNIDNLFEKEIFNIQNNFSKMISFFGGLQDAIMICSGSYLFGWTLYGIKGQPINGKIPKHRTNPSQSCIKTTF